MNTTFAAPATSPASVGRVLAIEPDPLRARGLRNILRKDAGIELEIVRSVEQAIACIDRGLPDLVLTPAFLPPADETTLTSYVRQLPGASRLQIITTPYFVEVVESRSEESSAHVLSFFRRRPSRPDAACDPALVRAQIEEYLEQARAARPELVDSPEVRRPSEHAGFEPAQMILPAPTTALVPSRPGGAAASSFALPSDRRRARRRRAGELPWLWTVRLPWGTDVRVVDISAGGVLVETTSRITPGSTVDLQLLGQDTNVRVPARMIRTDVAGVDALGVRYRVAAAFSRDVDLAGLQPAAAVFAPKILGDVLGRVLADVDRGAGPAVMRARFENELRKLVPVRDIQIRRTPVVPEHDAESIYFKIHGASGPILQAIFEPGQEPTELEFRILKAAASLAAAVLEFAPLLDETRVPMLTS